MGAGMGAEELPPPGEEGEAQQIPTAGAAAEAGGQSVPVLPLVRHLALLHAWDMGGKMGGGDMGGSELGVWGGWKWGWNGGKWG